MADILLVEDDATSRRLMGAFLIGAGHRVVQADDAQDALRLIAETSVDLVVTDILMPEMDGLELILEIRRRKLEVAIVATSGGGAHVPVDILDSAASLGADGVLRKPFRAAQLCSAVDAALKARHPDAGMAGVPLPGADSTISSSPATVRASTGIVSAAGGWAAI